VLSNGSFSSLGIGVGGFAGIEYVSSPIVEEESGIEGDGGGRRLNSYFLRSLLGRAEVGNIRRVRKTWRSGLLVCDVIKNGGGVFGGSGRGC
jgi:hypothetical protein